MKTKKNRWILEGVLFGTIMLVFSIIIELIEDEFSFDGFWKRIIVWMIGGFVYALAMKFVRSQGEK